MSGISWKLVVSIRVNVNLDALSQTNAVLLAVTQTTATTIAFCCLKMHAEYMLSSHGRR